MLDGPKNTDENDFATLQALLTGHDLNICPSYTLPKGRTNLIKSQDDVIKYSMEKIHPKLRGGLKLIQKEEST